MEHAIGVVAHVDRQDQISYLSKTVEPDLIEVDDGTLGATANHVQTLLALSRKTDGWCIVMEDDARPIPSFHYEVGEALACAPTPIVSFYLGTGYPQNWQHRIREALEHDTSWIICNRLLHGVCYAVHPSLVDPLITRMTSLARRKYGTDDAISKYALEAHKQVAYTNPSLVDHEDGPPVLNVRYALGHLSHNRKRPRHAHKLGTRLTWTDNAVIMGH